MSNPKLIAFSGAHGTGKTAASRQHAVLLSLENTKLKIGLLSEIASECPFRINRGASEDTQHWLFNSHVNREIELSNHYDLVVCDRSIIDYIAYTNVLGYHYLGLALKGIAQRRIHTYREIIFRTIEKNNYCYDNGLRESSDFSFRLAVEQEMIRLYNNLHPEKITYV